MNNQIVALLKNISDEKARLDELRPLPSALVKNITDWFRVELAHTSNALEGNTLTASETAIVIEKGITIAGKSMREHLEAINHAHAFDFILELARKKHQDVDLNDILDIHRIILRGIDDENAGRWRKIMVRIAGADVKLADPIKVPDLMEDFIYWLYNTDEHPVMIAANAHLKLVTIHPFVDGNGRTARLLMNLLLMQAGYPPAIITPAERKRYIDSLQSAQLNDDPSAYHKLIIEAVERSLKIYLDQASRTI